MEENVVIVDYDCLTSLGADVASTWERAAANASGVRPIDRYAPESEGL